MTAAVRVNEVGASTDVWFLVGALCGVLLFFVFLFFYDRFM